MSKIKKVSKAIQEFRELGFDPVVVCMSRSFAIALKTEMMPEINKYFVNGRMTIEGVPWELANIKGFKVGVAG